MNKITFFDVEYANSHNKSICQIGILCEDYKTGNPFYPERNVYINPEDGFDDNCIKIHGITEKRVKEEKTFPEIWRELEKYFTNSIIIGHNVASADLDALVRTLKRYNIDIPEMYYICTLELSKENVPRYAAVNYSMTSLCKYFDIDIDSEHNAFDDACANADLFKALVSNYSLDINKCIKKYTLKETHEFINYISDPVLRKKITEFYGIIRGFSIDNEVNVEEVRYIKQWKKDNQKYSAHKEIATIIKVIDEILSDGIITVEEVITLQKCIKGYLDSISVSPVTLATQILDGILKGIVLDDIVTEKECRNLQQWLYDNIYLSGHYPFDKIIKTIEDVLEDFVVTKEESEFLIATIDDILNPIEALKEQINIIDGKSFCLSGNFLRGKKSDIETYIKDRNGHIESNVKKTLDVLLVGDLECQAYSNGTYGSKVKKAIEYNQKGGKIQIVKESDFFKD